MGLYAIIGHRFSIEMQLLLFNFN